MQAHRRFTVQASLLAVHTFLADFSTTEQWDPGTQTCVRTDDGPLQVGSTWHNVSLFRGRQTELDYRLETMDPGQLRFVGANKTASTIDDLRLSEAGNGRTEIAYTGTIAFHGLVRFAEPFLRRSFDKLADQTVDQMTGAINDL